MFKQAYRGFEVFVIPLIRTQGIGGPIGGKHHPARRTRHELWAEVVEKVIGQRNDRSPRYADQVQVVFAALVGTHGEHGTVVRHVHRHDLLQSPNTSLDSDNGPLGV